MIYGLIGFLIGAGLLFILSYILPKGRIKKHNDELDKEEQAQSARIDAIRKSADLEAIRAENLICNKNIYLECTNFVIFM